MLTAEQETLRHVADLAPSTDKAAIYVFLPSSYVQIEKVADLVTEGPEMRVIRDDLLRKISQDAKEVVSIILDSPIELLNSNESVSLTKLCNKLKHELGWTWSRIGRVRNELTELVANLG